MCAKRCVIFDLDGTLTQSEEGIWNCVRYAAEKCGFPEPDAATLRKFVGPPLSYSFREYLHMPDEMADVAVAKYRERYSVVGLFENRVYPGIRRLLQMLRRQGAYVAVATGKPQVYAERVVDHFGLTKWFDKVVGPGMAASHEKDDLPCLVRLNDAGAGMSVIRRHALDLALVFPRMGGDDLDQVHVAPPYRYGT